MSDERFEGAGDVDGAEGADESSARAWLANYRDEELPEVASYTQSEAGIVYLVGAGPGDPGLLTVRARQLLDRCDAIVHDALTHPAMLARSRADMPPAELFFVGKRGGDAGSTPQEDINTLLVTLARAGRRVVRLKGGDPFVFGRGSEEAQALTEAGVAFEVVPGVTAGIAAPAYAGIPVTHRGMSTSVTLVTGHEAPDRTTSLTNWAALAQAGGTLVLYMGVKRLPAIVQALVAGGLPGEIPAAAVEWGTLGRQRTVTATLETLADAMRREAMAAPVIIVVGWTVVLREEIAWFDQRPLFGRRVVITRPAHGSRLAERLRELGADVLDVPATRLEQLDPAPLREALQRLDEFDWLVLTSQNAVRYLWQELRGLGLDARALATCKLAAVGPATADALLAHGLAVDVTPERFVAEGLLEALGARDDVIGARVLLATAQGARELLPDGLMTLGADVEVVHAYRSVPDAAAAAPLRAALDGGEADLVTFTSASTVRGFVEAVGAERAARVPAVCIGPATGTAARAAGLDVRGEAAEATMDALVQAVLELAMELPPREPPRSAGDTGEEA